MHMPEVVDRTRYEAAMQQIDAANAEDPNVEYAEGTEVARELLYSRRMTACLERFAPDASEALCLAARAQHIRRWTIPRKDYPMDRAGYKEWRSALGRFHAETAGRILVDAGYEESFVDRVQRLLRKEKLKLDPEVQTLEDVACLVFLEFYLEDFARRHDDDKLLRIIRRTWIKMSPRGQEVALTIPLSERLGSLVTRALEK